MTSEKGYVVAFSLDMHAVKNKVHLIDGETICWMNSRKMVMS
jgi:hypothetical protein